MNQYKKGEIVTGCVTGIEKYGIFVSLDDYYSGLIHISEISDFFVKNPINLSRKPSSSAISPVVKRS